MNSIIWQFEAGEKEAKIIDPVIPPGQEVSLSEDALETAFALLSSDEDRQNYEPIFEIPPKLGGVVTGWLTGTIKW